jgi:spoIIIJ-associated protein
MAKKKEESEKEVDIKAKKVKAKKEGDLAGEIEKLLDELFSLLGVSCETSVLKVEEGYKVEVDSSDSGLLIGSHGSTLNAIQSFLALTFRQRTGEWVNILVDVGGWRDRHEDYLQDLARQAAERARSTGEAQHLYNLNPSQRRTIHLYLGEEKDLITESEGEGRERYLVVKTK